MIILPIKDLRVRLSEMIDASQHESVYIAKHGKEVSVLISKKDFDRLKKIEDEWWMSNTTIPAQNSKEEILEAVNQVESGEYIEDPLV